jgi:hypothetical protein
LILATLLGSPHVLDCDSTILGPAIALTVAANGARPKRAPNRSSVPPE